MSLLLRPHAKVNLGLRILGRRPDGYHELETRFQTIDLCDEIEMEASARTLRVRVEDAALPADASNLVVRAAQRLRAARRGLPGASILLRKRIPVAAGLGGGSSDAAATLMGLCHLWSLELTGEELQDMAAGLGADVPFFLVGGCARGSGRGDRIMPLPDLPDFGLALLLPEFTSSTEEAFRRWDERFGSPGPANAEPPAALDDLSGPSLTNDFEPILFDRFPVLPTQRDRLLRLGASAAALSGSGPSLYGIFAGVAQARVALKDPLWGAQRGVAAAPVGRAAYRTSLGIPLSD